MDLLKRKEGRRCWHEKRPYLPSKANASRVDKFPKYESPTISDFGGSGVAKRRTVSCAASFA